jgi:hypothetical protein
MLRATTSAKFRAFPLDVSFGARRKAVISLRGGAIAESCGSDDGIKKAAYPSA